MKSLNSIGTSAFANCTVNIFDAPKLNSITEDFYWFKVGIKNFQDSPGIL